MAKSIDETRVISLSIWIDKPPERVYAALTVPDQLTRWLVPGIQSAQNAPRRLTLVYPHHSFEVEFLHLEPTTAVTLSWFHDRGVGPQIEFQLEKRQGGTLVKFRHPGFDPDPGHAQVYIDHVEGWTMYLCNLRCYLDADFDLRSGQPPGTIAM